MAESLGQATVDLIANTGGFEAGMDRAARKLQSVTKEAAYQGNQLDKLVGQIDPVLGAYSKLDKMEEQLRAHRKAGRLDEQDFTGYLKSLQAQRDALGNTDKALGKNAQALAANGQSLAQYKNNLRGVPAQFTDIVTSLQGGQKPLTVFLQQGGQLKDMFGGAGHAAKALGGYVLGIINPITLAGAAIAATGVAYYQGSKEATAYNTALINTGNFAGTSADSLAGMASRIAQTTGTVGAAAEVLAQLAASGKIPVESFELIATAALATQKATGQAASEIVANFIKIAEDPLKATLELNKQMNYLTETVYSQIAAFEAAGNKEAAVALAQDEYAKAQKARAAGIIEDLGYVEAAWNTVAAAAKGAWDAFLSVGRKTPLEDQIKKAQELVDDLARAKADDPFALEGANSYREEQAAKDLTDLLVQYDERQKRESSARIGAQQKKDALDAAITVDKYHKDIESKADQRKKKRDEYNRSIEDLRAGVTRGTVSADDPRLNAERIAADLDGIDEKYKDKKAARVKAFVEDAGAKELDQAKQVYAVLQAQSLTIGAQDGTTQKLGAAAQELVKWEQQIADIKTKGTLTAAQKSLLADESAITAQKTQNAQLEAQNALREKAAASAQKLLSLQQQLNDELQNVQSGFDQQMAGIGLGDEARKRLQDDIKIREDYQKKLEQLGRDFRKIRNPTQEDTDAYAQQNELIKTKLAERLAIQQNYYDAEDAAQEHWQNGALQAINNYMEGVNNLAGQTRSLVSNSLSGIEDVLVKLATDGKLSFKSLADSIIADLARIAAKTLVVQPLLNALTTGDQGGGGALSSLLGSGGSSSGGGNTALNILDAAGKSISVATSGFGQAVAAGYNAGEGLIGGIQGAFSSGTGYVSDAITSAFSAGSATAAETISASVSSGTGYQLGGSLVSGSAGSATYAGAAASAGLSATSALTYGIGGAIQGYLQAGIKGAVAGAGGAVAGAYAGAAIGSAVPVIGTAIGAAIGAVLGGMFGASLFGGDWVSKDQGIQLAVNGGDLQTNSFDYQKKKGGLFSSNKKRTQLSSLDPGLQASLDNTYATTLGTVIGLFDTLNVELNDAVLDGLNVSAVQISTKGKTADEVQAELVAFFTKLGDSAVLAVDTALGGIDLGGQTLQGLTNLVNGLFSVNNVLANLNVGIFDMTVSGAYMAEQLAAWAGGLDKFTEAGATYYDKFFSDTEKADDVLKAVGVQFASIGVGLPATRDGFRALVEAIDVTTESGRGLFTQLIALAGNASAAYDILEQRSSAAQAAAATQAAADAAALAGVLKDAFSASFATVQRSVAAQQKTIASAYQATTDALNTAISSSSDRISTLTSAASKLDSALKTLQGSSDATVKSLRSAAVATLKQALAAGGSVADFPGLNDALDAAAQVDPALYQSLSDFELEQARTTYLVDSLNKLNGAQLTAEQQTLNNLKDQLAAAKDDYDLQNRMLDAQLAAAQASSDAFNGLDTTVLGVTEAIKQMQTALLAALAVRPADTSSSASQAANAGTLLGNIYNSVLGRDADAEGLAYWSGKLASGETSYADIVAQITRDAQANGELPRFARGTNSWDGGPALMGEFGPELVMPNGGATVYNAQNTARLLGGSGPSASELSDAQDQKRKNDSRWDRLLRYTEYLEQGFINGFPTVAAT